MQEKEANARVGGAGGGGGGGSAVSAKWINGYCCTRNSGWNAPGGAGGGAEGGGRTGAGQSAAANTGGGGGGGGCNGAAGGTGGSGIVILRNTRFGATTFVAAKNGVFGSPVQITLSRDDPSATHTLKAVLLDAGGQELYTETIAEKTAVYPTVNWTPSVALYAPRVKNASSAGFQIRCITYVGGDEQGEEELDAPISLSFRAADVAPSMAEDAVTVSPYNAGAASGISSFIQGYSRADSSFDDSLVSLKYGASITKREVICGGVSSAVPPYRTGQLTGNTELIARITDSRGFTAQQSITIKPEAYAKPRLSGIDIFRCDSSGAADEAGGRISAKAAATVSSLAGENTCTLTAAIKTMYGSFGGEQGITNGAANVLSGSASPDETLIVRLTVTDRLGERAQYEHTLTHRKWAMKFRPNGEGVGFGKAPSGDKVLEIAEDWQIKRGQQILPWGATVALLWENPDISVPFDAQEIYLPGAARKLYLVVTRTGINSGDMETFICPNVTGIVNRINSAWVDVNLIINCRRMYVQSSDRIQIGQNDFMIHTGYGDVNNDWNIPWRIYGVNF